MTRRLLLLACAYTAGALTILVLDAADALSNRPQGVTVPAVRPIRVLRYP